MRWKWVFLAPLAVLGIVLFIFIGGEIVQLLWNWLLPPLFGWPQITFWQGLGLLVLCRILFGGFGSHGGSRSGVNRQVTKRVTDRLTERLVDRMGERWDTMTPEERERLRQRIRERCGFDPADASGTGEGA